MMRKILWMCVVLISLGSMVFGCVEDFIEDEEGTENFIGTYIVTGTETVNGKSMQLTDTITIRGGIISDLSITTQNFGTLKATVTGNQSFRIDKQDATVKTSSGKTEVTVQGKGTVSDGFLDISGSYSLKSQSVKFHLSGSRV